MSEQPSEVLIKQYYQTDDCYTANVLWEELDRRISALARPVIARFVANYNDVPDLLQTVKIRVLMTKGKSTAFDEKRSSFATWLKTIAKREAISHLRAQRPREVPEHSALGVQTRKENSLDLCRRRILDMLDPETSLLGKEKLNRALGRLSSDQRRLLFRDQLHSRKQLASEMKISMPTLSRRIEAARRAMRSGL